MSTYRNTQKNLGKSVLKVMLIFMALFGPTGLTTRANLVLILPNQNLVFPVIPVYTHAQKGIFAERNSDTLTWDFSELQTEKSTHDSGHHICHLGGL